MKLYAPLEITSRLMAGVRVGDATLSLELGDTMRDGRDRYVAWIDLPDGTEHEVTDLKSGCQGGSVADGLRALVSFLSACGKSVNYGRHTGRPGEHADLFAPAVAQWAAEHTDALDLLSCELDEAETLTDERED